MAPKRRSTRTLDTPSPPPPPMRPLPPAPPGMKWNTLTGGLMLDPSHRDHVARFRAAFPGEIDTGAYAESTRHVPPHAPAEYDQTHLLDIARRQQERDASISEEESEEEDEDEEDISEDFVSAREQQNNEVQPMGSNSPSLEEQDVPMDDVELGDEQEDADVDDDDEDDGGDDVEDEDVSMEDADEQYEDTDEVQQEEDEESEPEPEPEPMTRAERAIARKRANRTSLREKVTVKKYKERESD